MKILLINKFLYPKGGDATSALSTGELFRSKGHEVVLWGMKNEKDPTYPNSDIFVDEVDLNSAGGIKQQLKIAGNMLYSLEAKAKIEELIRREGKPDIVHLHNFAHQISPSILHIFRKYKIPCVMTMHDYKLVCASYTLLSNGKLCEKCTRGAYFNCFKEGCIKNSRAKSLLNTVEMYLHHKVFHIYDLIDVLIAPSKFLESKVKEMGLKSEIVHIPYFIKAEDFVLEHDRTEKYIVYTGRLSKEKGIATLINAVQIMPEVKLKIVGEGPIRKELEAILEREGIKNVELLGYKTGETLKKLVRNSMFVVTPSEWYENYPFAIIEAFALGKAVIGARIGGIPELVKDGETGLTFESRNAQDLADKIRTLLSQPDLIDEMGKKSRRFVETELNSEKYYTRLMSIYQQAIKKRQEATV